MTKEGAIARWVRKEKKKSDADKAAGRPNRLQRAANRRAAQVDAKLKAAKEKKDRAGKVVSGTAGVVHKNPSKKPAVVVAGAHPKTHLYGYGGTAARKPAPMKNTTETGHQVVSAPILKGATLKKN